MASIGQTLFRFTGAVLLGVSATAIDHPGTLFAPSAVDRIKTVPVVVAARDIPEGTLISDLKKGQKVSDLANDRHMTKEQFAAKLVGSLKPRLEQLVDHKQLTQARADRILDRISKGHVPFWDGIHRRR